MQNILYNSIQGSSQKKKKFKAGGGGGGLGVGFEIKAYLWIF